VARGDGSDVRRLAATDTGPGRKAEAQRVVERYLDRGPWLALALLPLVLITWRRGLPVLLLVLMLPQPALAFGFRDLWQRQDQQAHAALEQGDHARARALATDPARRGSAAYREQDFEAAAIEFAAGEGASSRYNLGNALAMGGRYQEAIAAYEEALALDPDLEDARANLDAVREWLEQQPEQSGEGDRGDEGDEERDPDAPSQGDSGEPEDADEDGSQRERQSGGDAADDEDEEKRGDDSGQPDGDSQDEQDMHAAVSDQAMMEDTAEALSRELEEAMQSQQEQEAEAFDAADRVTEEQRQMVEQWLRRVPDDPGALLRRKFAVEYRRRQAEGGQR
jgi:Ca-activated chloride channel homolog